MDRDEFGDQVLGDLAMAATGKIVQIFLRDLTLDAVIGVHKHEAVGPQRLVVNVALSVQLPDSPLRDRLSEVVDYEAIANGIKAIVAEGHVKLVETLAERIAGFCLADARVEAVLIRLEKPGAIDGARGAGVEIRRTRRL